MTKICQNVNCKHAVGRCRRKTYNWIYVIKKTFLVWNERLIESIITNTGNVKARLKCRQFCHNFFFLLFFSPKALFTWNVDMFAIYSHYMDELIFKKIMTRRKKSFQRIFPTVNLSIELWYKRFKLLLIIGQSIE